MRVLDAAAFINAAILDAGDCFTTRLVLEELCSLGARSVADAGIAAGKLRIVEPSETVIKRVRCKAEEVGSLHRLSTADIAAAALALELGATLVTDDWTLQNLAAHLGLRFEAVARGKIKKKRVFKS